MKLSSNILIAALLVIAFLFRLFPVDFPFFTSDEARIAVRAQTLAVNGSDELGRKFPVIFNSLSDYELPLTSYTAAAGVSFFGKSDLGVRLPFILVSTLVVLLSSMAASVFNPAQKFRLLVVLITAFSPVLIFLSKVPNEIILLTFLFLLLFYTLTRKKFNLSLTVITSILLLITSKIAWFTLLPFTIFTLLIFRHDLSGKSKLTVFITLLLTFFTIFLFLKIPQSVRSLMENNFPIFSEITIKNGIDKLRGQGLESGWPSLLERALFNKLHFLFVGFLHWLAHLQPATFFGQFDSTGRFGLVSMGAWSKILIIPFIFAIGQIIRKSDIKNRLLFGYFVVLTLPLLFVYPLNFQNILVVFLPFMSIFIAAGLIGFKRIVRFLTIVIMILEVGINIFYLDEQIKTTNSIRPTWIKAIVEESYVLAQQGEVALSDDIVDDIIPFFGWHTKLKSEYNFSSIDFPYKFRQYELPNIKVIGFDNKFRSCGREENATLILSNRDLDKVKRDFEVSVETTFKDNLNKIAAYKLKDKICIN